MGWGETGLSVLIRFLVSVAFRLVFYHLYSTFQLSCLFGEYPKVLENPISVSQINWGGDLEAGRGRAGLSICTHYGRSA